LDVFWKNHNPTTLNRQGLMLEINIVCNFLSWWTTKNNCWKI